MSFWQTLMRRNSVYVAFVLGGALVGEKIVTGAFDSAWQSKNKGKLYDDLVAKGIVQMTVEEE
eukprot:CAMPEP_0168610552 /NCGR_PEP_ID=MMETSP0449_2-20121227/1853_1 /TAXON_ID=1082188 /ORGANISM="Strombidium rassoulzadegani, Strain ras09" /LENGTH=62 /DNA_ID=CAMNT_0008650875 /DNA_START=81 /DNA_END=269 /DNA_ORIENTATION=-